MMGGFKVGDKVRRVSGGRHIDMKEGDEGTVEAVVRDNENLIIREFQRPGWSHSAQNFELVTPATLDPSKVAVGDTVTLAKGETTVRGPVTGISYAGGGEWDFRVGEEPYRRAGRIGLWAVTDHQSAPEPEPEWKPGTVAEGTVNGTTVRGLIGRDDNGTGDVFTYWNEFARHMSITGHVPDDVRPLAVMDPATVDELVDSISHALGERLPPEAVAYISRTDGNNDRRTWVRGLLNHGQPNLVRSAFQVLGIEAS